MRAPSLPTWIGLGVAFLGPLLLVTPAQRLLGDPARLRTRVLEQLVLWALLAAVVWIVLAWERRPLASIGVRPFAWGSVAWGLGLAALLMWVVTPLSLRLLAALRLAGFESGIASFAALPLGLKLLAVLGAGVVEETLYRGFALVAHTVVDAMGLIVVPSLQRGS